MTISNGTNTAGPFTGNGATTSFPFAFRLYDADHIKVYQTVSDVTTEVVAGFTVTGVGAESGSVVFDTAPESGAIIDILREVPLLQESDYSSQGRVDPEQIERDLDLQEMQIQQLDEAIGRAIVAPVGYQGAVPTIAQFTADAAAASAAAAVATASEAAVSLELAKLQSAGTFYPEDYGTNTEPGVTDMAAAVNAAAAAIKATGKPGILKLRPEVYAFGSPLVIDWPIFIEGVAPYWTNIYTDDGLVTLGSWIKALPGLNDDVVKFNGHTGGTYPRVHSGMIHVGVNGNRSGDQAPSANDLNNAGCAIRITDASYVTLSDVVTMRAAEHGVRAGGTTNNLDLKGVVSLSNRLNGFFLYAGDSKFSNLVAGYNGQDGMETNAGPVSNARFWNNVRYGVRLTGGSAIPPVMLGDASIYDNGATGVEILSGDGHTLTGLQINDNGRNTGNTGDGRANVAIGSSAGEVSIASCAIGRLNYGGKPGYGAGDTLYGISATSGAPKLSLGPISWIGEGVGTGVSPESGSPFLDLFNIADRSNIRLHARTGDDPLQHPGFVATSGVDMDAFSVENVGGLTLGSGVTFTSVTGSEIDAGGSSLVTLNVASPVTINSITSGIDGVHVLFVRNISASNVTFTHNTSAIRMHGGTSRTLNQYECWMFLRLPGSSIWQQVGTD